MEEYSRARLILFAEKLNFLWNVEFTKKQYIRISFRLTKTLWKHEYNISHNLIDTSTQSGADSECHIIEKIGKNEAFFATYLRIDNHNKDELLCSTDSTLCVKKF